MWIQSAVISSLLLVGAEAEAPLGLGAAANKRSPIRRDLFRFFVCFVLAGRRYSDDASVECGEFVGGHLVSPCSVIIYLL